MKRISSILVLTAIAVSCSAPGNNKSTAANGEKNSNEAITDMTAASEAGVHEIQTTAVAASQVAQIHAAEAAQPVHHHTGTSASGSTAASTPATATTVEEVKKRKKLNNTAKGIIIGLGAGAITGAAVDKNNRGKGAIIGAAVGAAAGGATGAVMDHRQKEK